MFLYALLQDHLYIKSIVLLLKANSCKQFVNYTSVCGCGVIEDDVDYDEDGSQKQWMMVTMVTIDVTHLLVHLYGRMAQI